MASFLPDLVKPYVEKLINGAITESSYICCFTCIAKDFEDEKTRLEVESTTFNQRIDVATRRGENVQANALLWKEEAEELIQEDTKTKPNCYFGFCCDCIWRYRRGKELANKKEQIKKLMETGKELAIGLPAHLPDIERYSSQHYIPFESRKSKYKELLDALNDDQNYIVGLQGMGGTGKTTLAKEVGKELKRSNQFTHVIDTTVSFSPDIKKIQDDIAGPLGLKFDGCTESDRPKILWRRLTNGEKILLILDDVWVDIDFEEIGIPQSDNRKGCHVFVTTRNLQVCNRLGCSRKIQLDLLSEEDAWIMFQRHACLSEVSTKNLLDRGRKIANECKRLPIAIAVIASSLKGEQRREKWDVALNSLQKHMSIGGVDEDMVDIYKCLNFSYEYLKNKTAEGLFLLCSVFQEDEEISIKILTRLGIGVGLFGESYDKYNNARNLVVVAKDKLLDSCLLLKTNKGDVKMHDLIREVAQWIANKDQIQVVNLSYKNQKSLVGRDNNIKYLLFDGNPMDLCSFRFDGSKLMILIFNMGEGCFEDIPVSFFENIAGLRVLNLIAGRRMTISLPQSIRSLTNIRSLLVEKANLGDISVLGSLQSLETLDLSHCTIDELPEEIAKLKELRLLNLEKCTIKSHNPFEVIQRCPSLEELYFLNSFNDFCQEITLPTLERYYLSDYYISYDSSLSKCVSLKNDSLSEETFKHVMQTAEFLELQRIKMGWRNLIPKIVPIDQGMNDLIELHLEHDSQLQCLVDTTHTGSQVPNVFSKLVVLVLFKMENLKELCNGPISFDSMNNLEKLTIKSCGNLRSLFKGNVNLSNLKTLKIEECSTLVSVFHLSTSGSLPLLEELDICRCGKLENIFTVDDAVEELDIRRCEKLIIMSCGNLKSLFKGNVNLSNLKILEILQCSTLVSVFHLSTSGSLPLLEELEIWHCEKLENIFTVDDAVEELDIRRCEKLIIMSCGNLKSLFKGNVNLSNLKILKILQCSTLVSVFHLSTSGSLPLLEELEIWHCEKLENIFTVDDGVEEILVSKLKVVNIFYCYELTYIFDQEVKLDSLIELVLDNVSNYIDIFPKSYHSIEGSSNSISKPQTELQLKVEPNIFSWSSICCYRNKLKGATSTKVPLVSEDQDQPQACSISTETSSDCPNIWERAQCLSRLSHIICNIKVIKLTIVSKIKSVFMLSIETKMLSLESLTILCCDELEHIVVDCGDGTRGNELGNVFPKLKELDVAYCEKLKYIFGHINANDDHDQNSNEIQLHLPALKSLKLEHLPSLIGMCPKQYHITFSPLKELDLIECSEVDVKYIGDFTFPTSISRYHDTTTIKQLSGNMEHFLALESLKVSESNVESILCLNEESERQIDLGLKNLILENLPMMIYLFMGPKNAFALKNLKKITISQCQKLKIVFSTSTLRWLSQLSHLIIRECNELKHIIEEDDDIENAMSSKTCFPLLETLAVVNCNKLKSVFPISMKKELLELKVMMIGDADELEEIFQSVGDDHHKVHITNLKVVAFVNLPSLCHDQGIQFQNVENRFVQNCKELSLTSKIVSSHRDFDIWMYGQVALIDLDLCMNLRRLFKQTEDMMTSSQKEINRTPEKEHEFIENVPDLEIPSVATIPTNSQELISEQSTSQQYLTNYLEGSETRNVPLPPTRSVDLKQKGIAICVEEGSTSSNAKIIASSTHLELASSSSDPLVTSSQELLNEQSKSQQHPLGKIHNVVPPSQELISEQSTSQQYLTNQHSLGEIDTTIKLSQGDYLEGSETRNVPPINLVDLKQKGILVNVEEGIASTSYANTIKSSTHLESEYGDGQIDIPLPVSTIECLNIEDVNLGDSHETTQTNNQVSPNDDAFMQVSSTIQQQDDDIVSRSRMPSAENSPTNSQELMNEQSMHQQRLKNQEHPLGEIASSTHFELASSSQEQNVDARDFQETKTKTNIDQAFMKVSSIIKEQFSKDDPSPSNSLPMPFSFQTNLILFEGNPSQLMPIAIPEPLTTKDADVKESQKTIKTNNNDQGNPSQIIENSSSIVIWELEQLVSKNCLDYESLSLLTDFLVKHPSVLLRDTSLGNKYKGYAYICLAELLQFLQTHSVLDVLGSSNSKFLELLQEVRSFGFDKDWLDSVEKRALFSDIQVSQDALQKLSESKQQVSKEVEVLRMKIDIFNQHVEDLKHQLTSSEAVLESIIQQEAQVLETKAALSAPLGY